MFYVRTWACCLIQHGHVFINNIRMFYNDKPVKYIQWFLIKAQYDFATFTLQAYNITTIKESKGTIKEKDIVV